MSIFVTLVTVSRTVSCHSDKFYVGNNVSELVFCNLTAKSGVLERHLGRYFIQEA